MIHSDLFQAEKKISPVEEEEFTTVNVSEEERTEQKEEDSHQR